MMPILSLIAAIDENRGIGKDNQLLCHLPADLKYFKETTLGKPVIMGRKTYESIGKPLPGRQNIVLSRSKQTIEGVTIVKNFEDALLITKDVAEIMIIGGSQIFKKTLLIADRVYLTTIYHHFDADVFFPTLEKDIWHCEQRTFRPRDEKNPYDMAFSLYKRVK